MYATSQGESVLTIVRATADHHLGTLKLSALDPRHLPRDALRYCHDQWFNADLQLIQRLFE